MQELEKILEEIDETIERYGKNPYIDEKVTDLCYGLNIAKDIIRKHMNDGWIPVEERLPTKEECEKDNNEFLVQTNTGERFSCEYDPLSNGYDNPLWCCNVPVVAWQSLPEPYRPERSEGE